jgi:hypothetical protein
MEINQEHVVSFMTGALSLYGVLKAIASATKTTKDDELVEAAQKLKAWTESKARVIWPMVEFAATAGKLPAGVSKAIWALEQLKKAYTQAHGSDLPKVCEDTARRVWAELSVAEKEN